MKRLGILALRLVALMLGVLAWTGGPALGADGVLGISQACAESAAGCFPGDAQGLPVTITQPGSYGLTGNLTLPDENTTGITISADDVVLDLGGFAIVGVVTCSGTPVTSCTPSGGTGYGVEVDADNVTVRNGTIRGAGDAGLLGSSIANAFTRVEGVTAVQNGSFGFLCSNCTFKGNAALSNGSTGAHLSYASIVLDNFARHNLLHGVSLADTGVMANNVSIDNGAGGIVCNYSCTITNNTSTDNGTSGIAPGVDCTVIGNTVVGNTGTGLSVVPGGFTGYVHDVINGNGSTVGGDAVSMGTSVCDDDTTCP